MIFLESPDLHGLSEGTRFRRAMPGRIKCQSPSSAVDAQKKKRSHTTAGASAKARALTPMRPPTGRATRRAFRNITLSRAFLRVAGSCKVRPAAYHRTIRLPVAPQLQSNGSLATSRTCLHFQPAALKCLDRSSNAINAISLNQFNQMGEV